jgi:5-aminopentanamidase
MRVAIWQTAEHLAGPEGNLAALERTAAAAAKAGAALLLCPECWLCGYHIGDAVKRLAEEPGGASAQRVAAIARQNGIAIAYGYAERDAQGTGAYNSAQVIGPTGQVLLHYRKTHLFGPAERSAYRPGDRIEPPFRFAGFTIGLLICYDVEFPEAVRTLALMGADLILVPTAQPLEYAMVAQCVLPARAVESQLCIAYCNHAGVENGLRYLGGSCLIGTNGRAVVTAGSGEALLIGELSVEARAETVRLFPYLADRRPELYRAVAEER